MDPTLALMYITCNIHQSIVLEVMDEEYMSRFIPILSYIAVTSISKAIIYVAEAPPKKKKKSNPALCRGYATL